MVLAGKGLQVALVTRHIALRDVADQLTQSDIASTIRSVAELADDRPIAVCGLNPHAGDGGLMGDEERTLIAPAIAECTAEGLNVVGPVPADTVFHQAVKGAYSVVVAMYHDQGLGPLKMHAFDEGVNITVGLPIVRTSPDHGTAYDIAGTGKADPSSMICAIQKAIELAGKRK
jgi:4-hydroxythreonine-4-phosphate dehydrogenase